jgi:hypothetical protein
MNINRTGFGWIEIDGRRYSHDVIVRPDGMILNRYDGFSGDSHLFTRSEADKVLVPHADQMVVGTGQMGILCVAPEVTGYLKQQNVNVFVQTTPRAIQTFNSLSGSKCGVFHVTC